LIGKTGGVASYPPYFQSFYMLQMPDLSENEQEYFHLVFISYILPGFEHLDSFGEVI